ncbi:hypothetical protein CSW98_03955 [Vibrio sp. HA2012]|uniref:hypothetical protein n=1 Tax=Vibrio sp. HA2012 TaxID=1971595 RepID=UPI000C2C87ED|nr:hypothetical protein [Vibrio sp. HA2012]PJC87071.1 hypothetical protein CSW98_03955 [Vibrio sp. HA2012]
MRIFSEEEEVAKVNFERPHCVLLGAGASLAAFPYGDRNGRKLPVMKNFVETLGIESYLAKAGVEPPYDDFEAIYAQISSDPSLAVITQDIEKIIYDYFSGMELPDHPTLYDHLVLSLREKDVIATFNWDPFLFQAIERNRHFAPMPRTYYLHGSVALGICHNCKIKSYANMVCAKCGENFENSKILYPVTEKNYTSDSFISAEWAAFKRVLKSGYIFTIFGYGAPVSDIEAVKLLKDSWGTKDEKSLEEIEVIDVLTGDELADRWDDFIHTHHYRTTNSFYTSLLARHPRRSCEALWECLMMLAPSDGIAYPEKADFAELYSKLQTRIDAERV